MQEPLMCQARSPWFLVLLGSILVAGITTTPRAHAESGAGEGRGHEEDESDDDDLAAPRARQVVSIPEWQIAAFRNVYAWWFPVILGGIGMGVVALLHGGRVARAREKYSENPGAANDAFGGWSLWGGPVSLAFGLLFLIELALPILWNSYPPLMSFVFLAPQIYYAIGVGLGLLLLFSPILLTSLSPPAR